MERGTPGIMGGVLGRRWVRRGHARGPVPSCRAALTPATATVRRPLRARGFFTPGGRSGRVTMSEERTSAVDFPMFDEFDPDQIEARWQRGVGGRAHLGGRQRRCRPGPRLCSRAVALHQRRAARRPPEELRRGRRRGALLAAPGPLRPAPDGLRRVRPARREPCDPDRQASAGDHRRVDRIVPRAVQALGPVDRLEPGDQHARSGLLPLDAVDLLAAVSRPAWPTASNAAVNWCPRRRDRPGQRAGGRRLLRTVRRPGAGAPDGAVVLPDHRVCRPAAGRARRAALARPYHDHAAELDRPL